jgi:hypothetical protein
LIKMTPDCVRRVKRRSSPWPLVWRKPAEPRANGRSHG